MIKGVLNDVYIRDLDNITELEISLSTSSDMSNTVTISLSPVKYINDTMTLKQAFSSYFRGVMTNLLTLLCNTGKYNNIDDALNSMISCTARITFDEFVNYSGKFTANSNFLIHVVDAKFPYENTFLKKYYSNDKMKFLALFNNGLKDSMPFEVFIHLLYKIFVFYLFEKNRVNLMYNILSSALFEYVNILFYDRNMEKYICIDSVADKLFMQKTKYIEAKRGCYKECYNLVDVNKIHQQSNDDNVLVGYFDTIKSTYFNISADSIPYLHGYVGRKFYSNNKNSKESVSILLYCCYKNDVITRAIVNLSKSYNDKLFIESLFDILENENVFDLMHLNLKSFLTDSNIKLKVEYVCDNVRRTIKTHKELETCQIPKERRDNAYIALCAVCDEIDINVEDVLNNLDVHFVKFFKKKKI